MDIFKPIVFLFIFSDLIFKSITTTSFERYGYYTIVKTTTFYDEDPESDLVKLFRDLWHNNIVNVNILTYSNRTRPSILLHTYFPFAPSRCGRIIPVIWNSFDNGHFEQPNKQMFPLKTQNLFQCPIPILVSPFRPYIFITGNNSDGSYDFDGIEYHLLDELSKRLNFRLNITIYGDHNLGALYGGNGSAGGAFGMVLERKYDLLVGALFYGPNLKRILSSTIGYSYDNLIAVVPNPRHYSSFETLFFPFTLSAWMIIATTLVLAVTVIKLLQRIGRQCYKIVAGPANVSPYLNLLRVLLTASAFYKPKESFARFVLMVWILASFVLQNVYQGQLFYFIKSHKMVESVKSIDELIKKGISIKTIEDNYGPLLKFDQRFENVLKFIDPHSKWQYVTETEAYITLETQLSETLRRTRSENLLSPKPKTIQIASNAHIIYLSKRFYLMESLNGIINFMNENGLTFKWSAPYRGSLEDVDINIPRQLNVSQILGVVQAWFGLAILAIILFISEIIFFRWATAENTVLNAGYMFYIE